MRSPVPVLAIALLAGCSTAAPDRAVADATQGELSAQARRALAGKVAGEPVPCLDRVEAEEPPLRLPNGGLLYRASDDLVFVQDFGGTCAGVLRDTTYLTRQSIMPRMCRGEPVSVTSRVHGTPAGSCVLANFVPYRRADR